MVQLSDLQTIMREMPRLDRQGFQPHAFDPDPITDADFEAFNVAVQFLCGLDVPVIIFIGNAHGGMTPKMLATRAERLAAMCGRDVVIANGIMIAAMTHLQLPIGACLAVNSTVAHPFFTVSTSILGPVVKAALDDHRAAADIMQKAPEPLTGEEAKVLAILALHGIDAPDGQIRRVFMAPRPDQIACIYKVPGTMWLRTETLLPIGRAVKLGLDYLFEPSK